MTDIKRRKLIKLLTEKKVLVYGDFILTSGEKSTYYCDIKKALGVPGILKILVSELSLLIDNRVTCIACSGYGGIALGSLVAQKKNVPLVLVRDKAKDYGTNKVIEGHEPNKKDVVCIIDDVFTTGGSIEKVKENLTATSCRFVKPIVVLNRSRSKKVTSLLQVRDIL